MRRIGDQHPGEAKTDARDAFIIAEAARTMPHALRSIQIADEQLAELTMLCGFDDDLAKQATATSNRIRDLLTQIHPALERVRGPRLDHPALLDLLRTWPTPEALRHAGRRRIGNRLKKLAPRMGSFVTGPLRPETGRRQTTQPSPHRPRPPPLRHPLRHAQKRHLLRTTNTLGRLTKTIEAPPDCREPAA